MPRRLSKKRVPKKGGVKRKTRRGGQPTVDPFPDVNEFNRRVREVQDEFEKTQLAEVAAQEAQKEREKAREKAAAKGSSRRRRYRR